MYIVCRLLCSNFEAILVILPLPVQLREITAASGGSTPTNSSLTILPQTLGQQYSLLVWKVSYTTAELALAGQLESVFCSDHNFTINSNRVVIDSKPDIVAVMRSGIVANLYNSVFYIIFFSAQ